MIRKQGDKYVIYSKDGSKKLGEYDTERDAKKRLQQIEYFKHMKENWSDKYKKSIDCNNPKGFSQRAHCQGKKKKMNEEENPRKMYHKHFMKAMKAMPGSQIQAKHKAEMEKYKKMMGKSFIDQVAPKKMAKFDRKIKEDAPTVNVGGGQVAGLGVGPQGEPGIKKRKRFNKGELLPFYAFVRRKTK